VKKKEPTETATTHADAPAIHQDETSTDTHHETLVTTKSKEILKAAVEVVPEETALDVVINLAGEVPGLKPPAVTKAPKPPRIFVIKRNCEAIEVVRLFILMYSKFQY